MKTLHLMSMLKQQGSTIGFMGDLLLEKGIVVQKAYNPADKPKVREVEGFIVHYNDDLPDMLNELFNMIIEVEFEGVMPAYPDFLTFIQQKEAASDMPEQFKLAADENPIFQTLPLYCTVLDHRERKGSR